MRAVPGRAGVVIALLLVTVLIPYTLHAKRLVANKAISVKVVTAGGKPALRIVAAEAFSYRFTAFSEKDPDRIVLSFPHIDFAGIATLTNVYHPLIKRVDISSQDLAGSRLGRVELLLNEMAEYEVDITDNQFLLTLTQSRWRDTSFVDQAESPPAINVEPMEKQEVLSNNVSAGENLATASTAGEIVKVDVGLHVVKLLADGVVENYKFFSLEDPERLVVDVYGVRPAFMERSFELRDVFSRIRVGVYDEKVRFVFDVTQGFPDYEITNNDGDAVVVSWSAN